MNESNKKRKISPLKNSSSDSASDSNITSDITSNINRNSYTKSKNKSNINRNSNYSIYSLSKKVKISNLINENSHNIYLSIKIFYTSIYNIYYF